MLQSARLLAVLAVLATSATVAAGEAPPEGRRPPPAGAPHDAAEREVAAAAARAVSEHAEVFAAVDGMRFHVKNVFVEPSGAGHVRFLRTWRGLKVLAGDFVVHLDSRGSLTGYDLATPVRPTPSAVARVDRERARDVALRAFTGRDAQVTAADLVVDAHPPAARLAWETVVTGRLTDGTPTEQHRVVDAATARELRGWEGIPREVGTGHGYHTGVVKMTTEKGPVGFVMRDSTRGGIATKDALHIFASSGIEVQETDNTWGDGDLEERNRVAVDAHYGAQRTWDYYARQHGHEGLDGDGKKYTLVVHAGFGTANAYWNDACMCASFGDGDGSVTAPFTSLDVVGHEITHGVTGATAGLLYQGESGGLNEASSDILGTLVEFSARNRADKPDYQIGEKVFLRQPLRWMDDPQRDGKSHSCWTKDTKKVGVHYSSGPANHFFFLLAVGSGKSKWGNSPTCGGAPAVRGIGNTDAGRIWVQALTRYMTSTTDYKGARRATLKAAGELFGASSKQARAVAAAWRAVGVR